MIFNIKHISSIYEWFYLWIQLFNLLAGFPYMMGHGFLWDGKYFDTPNDIAEQGRKLFCECYSSPNSLRIYA